jgi:hypothetical protein
MKTKHIVLSLFCAILLFSSCMASFKANLANMRSAQTPPAARCPHSHNMPPNYIGSITDLTRNPHPNQHAFYCHKCGQFIVRLGE